MGKNSDSTLGREKQLKAKRAKFTAQTKTLTTTIAYLDKTTTTGVLAVAVKEITVITAMMEVELENHNQPSRWTRSCFDAGVNGGLFPASQATPGPRAITSHEIRLPVASPELHYGL
ncbi:unnamed protein product [Dovyalis caffra]|uniref:Uncharacterized protein n=1 Tax=Dovyalis caffra TaxID=77055 RepID=A0AAV1S0D4_9ROSI|nr:unnamed protein product [Dovyalis caffra]